MTYQIDPGEVPTSVGVFGGVVKAPGTYEFRLFLTADLPGQSESRSFEFGVPVKVVQP